MNVFSSLHCLPLLFCLRSLGHNIMYLKDTKPHVKVIIVLSARIPHFVLFLKGIKNQGVKEKMFQKNVPRMKKSIKR